MKARTLLRELIDHGLTVKIVGDKIRLSPRRLINDKVLSFVHTYKNDLISALHNVYKEKKASLDQNRLHVLRCIIRRYLKPSAPKLVPTDQEIEQYIDCILPSCGFDLEEVIAEYRKITIKSEPACKCGYRSPFCSCSISMPGTVKCDRCELFNPDTIGDGAGIGQCNLGIEYTQEIHGRSPLSRYSDRHCDKFSKLMD